MTRNGNSGMSCIKYMLFTTNFMFGMIGFLLIFIGAAIKNIYEDFDRFVLNSYYSPSDLTIVIGALIFLVALLGCIGAIKESTFLVNMYALAMAFIFVLELAAAIAAYNISNNIDNSMRENLNVSLNNYNWLTYDKRSWDFLQRKMECCGIDSYKDWKNHYLNGTRKCPRPVDIDINLPDSCYDDFCHPHIQDGCLSSLESMISECAILLGCGALSIAFVQLLGVVFARMLASSIRSIKTQRLVRQQQRREQLFNNLYAPDIRDIPEEKKYVSTDLDPTQESHA